MTVPRYLFIASAGSGLVAWDTQTDTAYGGNPIIAPSFNAAAAFMALSGDGSTLYVRGNNGNTSPVRVWKVDVNALTAVQVPNSFGTILNQTAGAFLGCANDGSEFYLQDSQTAPFPYLSRLHVINGTTGVVRVTSANQGFFLGNNANYSYDGTTMYVTGSANVTFATLASMAESTAVFTPITVRSTEGVRQGSYTGGLSADGTILYSLYTIGGAQGYLIATRISDGFEVGRYTFPVSAGQTTMGRFSVMSADRSTLYTQSPVSPFPMQVIDLGTMTQIRQDTMPASFNHGVRSGDGLSMYLVSSAVYKYNLSTGATVNLGGSFASPFDLALTPATYPQEGGGGSGPATPTGITTVNGAGIIPGICEGGQATLRWVNPSPTSILYRNGIAVYAGAANEFVDTGLAVGLVYSYTVVATNGSGSSAPTTPIMVTPCITGAGCCTWNQGLVPAACTWSSVNKPC